MTKKENDQLAAKAQKSLFRLEMLLKDTDNLTGEAIDAIQAIGSALYAYQAATDRLASAQEIIEEFFASSEMETYAREPELEPAPEPDIFINPFGTSGFEMYKQHLANFKPNGASCPKCGGTNTADAVAVERMAKVYGNIGLFGCHDCQEVVGDC